MVGLRDVDVWLLLDDDRTVDGIEDWEIFGIARVGMIWRLATVAVDEWDISGIDDVEFVMDNVCCGRVVFDDGIEPVFVIEFWAGLDKDGVGMIVGRRRPPIVAGTDDFSILAVDDVQSLIGGIDVWEEADAIWRGLDWCAFEVISLSNVDTSKWFLKQNINDCSYKMPKQLMMNHYY